MRSFRFVTTAFSAAALVALLAGCGTTTSPTAVTTDTTAPAAPTSLSYSLDRTGTTLSWAPGPAGSISSYVIYMYQPDPSRSTSYVQVGTSTIATWGVPVDYQSGTQYFRVEAVNTGGNHSADSAVLTVTFDNGSGTGRGTGGSTGPRVD